tara:strand:- start:1257 stop:2351 length:1095 start_codon:yes stop_codon:yes gene_type:complete
MVHNKKKKIKYKLKKKRKNLLKFLLISFLLIFSFFSLPSVNTFLVKNLNFKNSVISNAGINFDQELEKRKTIIDGENETKTKKFNLKNIFADIDFFSTDNEGQNSIRFDARTIEQLFKDTDYSLEKVRKTKLVNIGNKIDHLPREIKNIDSSKKRKKLFIQIVLPLIVEENTKIRLDRKELFRILRKNINTKKEKEWLKEKFKKYGLKDGDFYSLKIRMDEIPVSLAIAQAAKETGWGTSRFAQDGNALFGQWTWSGEGIRPAGVDKDAKHKVAKFKVLKASVRAYQRNLNTHSSYIQFRKERAIQRDNDEKLDSLKLVNYLDKYAETGQEYINVLKKIIKQNSLKDFDDVNVMPTSNKTKKLI